VQQLDVGYDDTTEGIATVSRKSGASSPHRSGSPRRSSVANPGLLVSRQARQLETRQGDRPEGVGIGKSIATGLPNASPRRSFKSNPRPNDARQTRQQDVGPANYHERHKSVASPVSIPQNARQSSEQTHQEQHRRNTENDLVVDNSSSEGHRRNKKVIDADRRSMGESIRSMTFFIPTMCFHQQVVAFFCC
jgi:hypothetical protein